MASSRLLAAAGGGKQGVVAAASLLRGGAYRPSSNVMVMRHLSSGTNFAGSTNAGRGLGAAGAGQEVRGLGLGEGGGGRREASGTRNKVSSLIRLFDFIKLTQPLVI